MLFSCFLLFAIIYILFFCSLSGFLFYIARDKLTNFKRNKKYVIRNTIVDKMDTKKKKTKGKKQKQETKRTL